MLGTTYTFQLNVSNREGTTASVYVAYLFATVPETPSSGPNIVSYSSTSA